MKHLRRWLILSLIVHIIIVPMLFYPYEKKQPEFILLEVYFQEADEKTAPEPLQLFEAEPADNNIINDYPAHAPEITNEAQQQGFAVTAAPDDDEIYKIRRTRFFSQDALTNKDENLQPPSLNDFRKQLVFDEKPVPPGDDVSEMMRSRFDGSRPSYFTIKPDVPKVIRNETTFDFEPSEAQVRAMNYLFENQQGTQLDIYPDLAVSHPITAAQFDKSMDMLVEKGFVSREKVSPENLLLIATPFGGLPVETSSRNRRNPVYRYKPVIDKSKLQAFIQSLIYKQEQILERQPADSSEIRENLKELKIRLHALIN